ncbi:26S proteasome non-ATPase regulatory subunit 9 [Strigomonas culicis]|uniref:26S proteasome non-ATPase regulatory subunit 9 n=1 Tax=Strigomonas culicis TaxID=28005 RepID=S9USU6_9TRYP|nr:26S proteasome non-ATPase regulatory subunit 9 [Strigomonas culicis]|eukprot:EPY31973.1 26S proteasome non-ATPase regulatory subunit 9 [Strigomonas culicis]
MSSERAQFFESNERAKSIKEELLRLQEEKDKYEAELKESLEYLASTPVGLDKPLLDEEGFPRGDCDLYAIRGARNRVSCRRNDLKALQERMYEKLVELQSSTHEEATQQMVADEEDRRRGLEAAKLQLAEMEEKRNVSLLTPFLKVAIVERQSRI